MTVQQHWLGGAEAPWSGTCCTILGSVVEHFEERWGILSHGGGLPKKKKKLAVRRHRLAKQVFLRVFLLGKGRIWLLTARVLFLATCCALQWECRYVVPVNLGARFPKCSLRAGVRTHTPLLCHWVTYWFIYVPVPVWKHRQRAR